MKRIFTFLFGAMALVFLVAAVTPASTSTLYRGRFQGNGALLTNIPPAGLSSVPLTNAQVGPITLYGSAAKTNGWLYSTAGVLTSNANGSVNIGGGTVTASVALRCSGTNVILTDIMSGTYQLIVSNGVLIAKTNAGGL